MIKNIDKLIDEITSELKKFTDVAIVGMSGGADSTLVAILCRLALGKENVYGVHMPYDSFDKANFNACSKLIAEHLEIESLDICIGGIADSIDQAMSWQLKMTPSTLNSGNSRARSRMCTLYSIAHHLGDTLEKRVRVMGTCNLSENCLGYATKGGDLLSDIEVIGDLYKSEVYQLLDYFKGQGIITENMIDRVPSAGLFSGQTDQGELGYTYDEMEPSMRYITSFYDGLNTNSEIFKFVFKKFVESAHKRVVSPIHINLRRFCD